MFFNSTTWVESPFSVQEDEIIFAIGDVHGHSEELRALHELIRSHFIIRGECRNVSIVHLGDYIDRGPDSKGVLDFLSRQSCDEIRIVCIPGNHDQYLIELIQANLDPDLDKYFINAWYENGGIETMKSLKVEGYGRLMHSNNMEELSSRTLDALGTRNVQFLRSLELYYKQGNFFFVHAGVNTKNDFFEQDICDLLMIREPFLSNKDQDHYPFCVVHGHSISAPDVYPHRISVDAGVHKNGTLCAVEISEKGIRFIGVTKIQDFAWGARFNNKAIGLLWGSQGTKCG